MTTEEAIEIIKSRYDKWALDDKDLEAIQCIFPELAESEDERIRKEIIEFIQWCEDRGFTRHDFHQAKRPSEWIAYLEKQRINTEGDFARGYDCGYECCLNSHGAEWFEKQKEQKPEIRVKIPKFRVGDIIQRIPLEKWDRSKKIVSIDEHGYNYNLSHLGDTVSGGAIGFAFENDYELVEQKPSEWSGPKEFISDTISERLKSLPERFNLEPKQEWSEADEENISRLHRLLVICQGEKKFIPTSEYEKLDSWLTSLRPLWKPTEEQMEAFNGYIKDFQEKAEAAVGGWNNFDVMIRLYEQLKKLM